MTVILVIAGVLLIGYLIYQKAVHGGSCCGEHEPTATKTGPADRDITNYRYRYTAEIEGMVCSRCVRNVENAFDAVDGIYAKAGAGTKTVMLYSKRRLSRKEAAAMLSGTSYTLTDLKEENE
ncbi:MAG: hypothetical protein IKR73_04275 [Oscillospiraceae bacterium]|nr:hypothetical protein [Oscillospiraceae bacterium]